MANVISDTEARANLAQNVNFILRSRGLSQRDLAEAAERHVMSINNICCNRSLPGVTLVMAIAEAVAYTVEELTGPPAAIVAEEKRREAGKKLDAIESKRREKSLLTA